MSPKQSHTWSPAYSYVIAFRLHACFAKHRDLWGQSLENMMSVFHDGCNSDASCLYTASGVMQELVELCKDTDSDAPTYQQRLSRGAFQGVLMPTSKCELMVPRRDGTHVAKCRWQIWRRLMPCWRSSGQPPSSQLRRSWRKCAALQPARASQRS